jgi:hypothetical protein
MRDIQLEFVFSKCYKEATDEQRAGLNVNAEFLQEIETLKSQYNGQTDSLVLVRVAFLSLSLCLSLCS